MHIDDLKALESQSPLKVYTLGRFEVHLGENLAEDKWGRDKAKQLFQFLISNMDRTALHKEQIIDRIWEEDGTDQDFKVALHGINKTIEPERKARQESKYIQRQGTSYQLHKDRIWCDHRAMEQAVSIAHEHLADRPALSREALQYALSLYGGVFLPARIYEDWSSAMREKMQLLALGAYVSLAELLLSENPKESVIIASKALDIDEAWEEAYRVLIQAYLATGNRPQAIRSYQKCVEVLDEEFGIDPLPETKRVFEQVMEK